MSYQILVYVNIIALAFVELLVGADVTADQAATSETMQPGEQQKVTVTISKDDITGFAKLQLELPEGLTAASGDTKGASFTFKDQKAKFIWMSLPTQKTFKISYDLIADASASGVKEISGKLSYIENNERKTFQLPKISVDLGGSPVAESIPTVEEVLAEEVELPEEENLAANHNDLAMEGEAGLSFEAIEGQGGVSGTRSIEQISDTEFLVTVTVQKGEIRGFGKVQEILPPGFTALEKASKDAIFTFQDEIVKFVWLNLPADNELTVIYKLRSGNNPNGEYNINGEFSYLLDDETQKAAIGSSTFNVGPVDMVAESVEETQEETEGSMDTTTEEAELTTNTATEEVVEETAELAEEVSEQVVEETVASTVEETTTEVEEEKEEVTSSQPTHQQIPAPETGISYKVQITAGHDQVGSDYFSQRHRFNGMFSIEHHEGWIKYTTGSFGMYRAARDKREALNNAGHEFPGPFVTAYNDGVRITVQEALMISNQQWLQ